MGHGITGGIRLADCAPHGLADRLGKHAQLVLVVTDEVEEGGILDKFHFATDGGEA
jgi:hypothetical protein